MTDSPPGAKAIRIALHAAGIKFEDKHVVYGEYQELKKTTSDHGWKHGLPVLEVGGVRVTQSLAHLRYAGKKSGLYPTDDLQALRVDEVLDICQDVLTKTPHADDEAEKLAKRAEYTAGKMAGYMSLLAQRADENAAAVRGPWLVGAEMTIADLGVYIALLGMIRAGDFDGVPKDYTDAWPALAALEAAVPEHAIVSGYYKDFPRDD